MSKTNPETYQSLNGQLNDVLRQLQADDTGIDEAVRLYEQALKLIAKLETHLQAAETRVRELRARYAEDEH